MTFLTDRIVHLHASRRCNLRCVHCYSTSSPQAEVGLRAGPIISALHVLRDLGYSTLALSGGEPLLHPDVRVIVSGARRAGYRVRLTTNGTLDPERTLGRMHHELEVIAVSFDGMRARHDGIRDKHGSFNRAVETLAKLRAMRIPCAMTCTVSRGGLADVVDLYRLARQHAVSQMELGPVTALGRARDVGKDLVLSNEECKGLLAMVQVLSKAPGPPAVLASLITREEILAKLPEMALVREDTQRRPLAELVNPVVISEAGLVLPFTYGLPEAYSIARIDSKDAARLSMQIERWYANGVSQLRALVRRTRSALRAKDPHTFCDWYRELVVEAVGS